MDYDHGTGPSGLRVRRALKTKSARRAEELRTDLENRLWRGNLYGVDVVTTFDQAAVLYVEDGGEARFLIKIFDRTQHCKESLTQPHSGNAQPPRHYFSGFGNNLRTPARTVRPYTNKAFLCR